MPKHIHELVSRDASGGHGRTAGRLRVSSARRSRAEQPRTPVCFGGGFAVSHLPILSGALFLQRFTFAAHGFQIRSYARTEAEPSVWGVTRSHREIKNRQSLPYPSPSKVL
jgi:hypothetical protein